MDYVLLTVLLLSAIFIVVAVLFQKSGDEGLSSTIAGGNETYYGKDKAPNAEKVWFKWTLVVGIIFAVVVLAVYIIQPDYAAGFAPDEWTKWSEFSSLFS